MKKLAIMYTLMAMAATGRHPMDIAERDEHDQPKKQNTPAGMKEWDIDGVKVWAVTKKAAIKKARKIGNQ